MMRTFSKIPANERKIASPCPVCRGTRRGRSMSIPGANFVRCLACDALYQYPMPIQIDLSNRYDEEYFQYELRNEENFFNLMKLGLKDVEFESLKFPKNRKVLDVGCATGRLLADLKDRGWTAQGVEICGESVAYGRDKYGLSIFHGPLDEAAFPVESFHFVHSSHVIEHVTDPVMFMSEIYRILVPGGYLAITTPNYKGLQSRLFRTRWRSLIPDHVCLFAPATIRYLAEKEGFTYRRWKTWGGLAKGTFPDPIKRYADAFVKRHGYGDVMIHLFQKDAPGKTDT